MPIPSQTDMFGIVLEYMRDGEQRSRKQIKALVRERLQLTPKECSYKTSSGVPVYESRAGWAISYLSKAGMLERVSRGVYKLGESGRDALAENKSGRELYVELENIWQEAKEAAGEQDTLDRSMEQPSEKSPQEQIADLAADMNASLGSELMGLIMDREPAFFEKVVVELLERMGYGKGEVANYTNDGGIDGLITTDELGFRPIYTQAKRYAPDNKVGRPTLQAFVGALLDQRDGVFITTSSFTDDAIKYANDYPGKIITLIDGKRLTELMIKYGLGVAVEDTIEIKRIDSDYFGDE